jgi:hypothetical protein
MLEIRAHTTGSVKDVKAVLVQLGAVQHRSAVNNKYQLNYTAEELRILKR